MQFPFMDPSCDGERESKQSKSRRASSQHSAVSLDTDDDDDDDDDEEEEDAYDSDADDWVMNLIKRRYGLLLKFIISKDFTAQQNASGVVAADPSRL